MKLKEMWNKKEQEEAQSRIDILIGQKIKSDFIKLKLPKKYVSIIEVIAAYGINDSNQLLKILENDTIYKASLITKPNNEKTTKQIWKYELEIVGNQTIEMPANAEILTVQTQDETPCIWALVDPKETKQKRFIEVYGTGQDVHYDMGVNRKYLGTYQLRGGSFVFHVFEYLGV